MCVLYEGLIESTCIFVIVQIITDSPMIFCVCYRLSEQSRLVAEQKRLVNELRGRYEEAQQWNFKYKVYCH